MEINIRRATAADLPAIHELVRELAIFEKSEAQFTASLQNYKDSFAEGVFRAHVAEADQKVVGMVLYYLTYSTWKGKMLYLEDFVVQEKYRSHGVGKKLFNAYLEEAKETGCTMTKWQVLDWNTPAVEFYKKQGATIEKEWWNGKIIF